MTPGVVVVRGGGVSLRPLSEPSFFGAARVTIFQRGSEPIKCEAQLLLERTGVRKKTGCLLAVQDGGAHAEICVGGLRPGKSWECA